MAVASEDVVFALVDETKEHGNVKVKRIEKAFALFETSRNYFLLVVLVQEKSESNGREQVCSWFVCRLFLENNLKELCKFDLTARRWKEVQFFAEKENVIGAIEGILTQLLRVSVEEKDWIDLCQSKVSIRNGSLVVSRRDSPQRKEADDG